MYKFKKGKWQSLTEGATYSVICWNCNNKIASAKYYNSYDRDNNKYPSYIFICPHCNAPLIVDDESKQILLPLPGKEIKKLPEDIGRIYDEIRKSIQSGSFNGAIMLMRKLIMHIAVEEGDSEGKRFEEYVDFLCNEGIVPRKSRNKADSVRTLGNSTNHEIENRTLEEAQNAFEFLELLLQANYEFSE